MIIPQKSLKHDSAHKVRDTRCEIFHQWDLLIVRRSDLSACNAQAGRKIEATPQIGFFNGIR